MKKRITSLFLIFTLVSLLVGCDFSESERENDGPQDFTVLEAQLIANPDEPFDRTERTFIDSKEELNDYLKTYDAYLDLGNVQKHVEELEEDFFDENVMVIARKDNSEKTLLAPGETLYLDGRLLKMNLHVVQRNEKDTGDGTIGFMFVHLPRPQSYTDSSE